jgi:hypothetical protein
MRPRRRRDPDAGEADDCEGGEAGEDDPPAAPSGFLRAEVGPLRLGAVAGGAVVPLGGEGAIPLDLLDGDVRRVEAAAERVEIVAHSRPHTPSA